MSRSKKKAPSISLKMLNELNSINNLEKKRFNENFMITLYDRKTEIVPGLVGLAFNVYNGKSYKKVLVTESMVGFKLGEFTRTRQTFVFKKKKLKKKKKKKKK